ncbi:MAG: DEAD/DEAH box helicase [Gemmatimonadaceae bacterium]
MPNTTNTAAEVDSRGFAELGLDASILESLSTLGYEEPTPIQREAIPVLIRGQDILGQAATGTGKTAAFALPIVQHVASLDAESRQSPSAFILVPTRELAMQVAEAVHKYGKSLGVRVLPIYGGQAMQQQLRSLKRSVDVVVATPGRVLDHIRRKSIDLSKVRTVVLDEADEMLDMGFAEDLEAILTALPKERQTALFSATIAPRIAQIAKAHLKNPVRITIAREMTAAGTKAKVREVAYVVSRQHKPEALGRVLDMESPTSAIVFCRTRTEVDHLTEVLSARGYEVESLHGGHNQEQRDRVMRRFRDGTTQLLTATDVAARGLDIGHLSHVVNYDVPWTAEAYTHRVGRTGRAGREGVAITILEPREQRLLRNIEQQAKRKIAIEQVPTVVDVRARQMEITSASVREVLEAGEYGNYGVLVDALATDFDLRDIAAAAIKHAHETKSSPEAVTEVDLSVPVRESRPKSGPRDRPERAVPSAAGWGERMEKHERAEKSESEGFKKKPRAAKRGNSAKGDTSFVRIYIPIGKGANIRPGDLVGAIANEASLDSSMIGSIEIADKFSLVEVPEGEADTVIEALNRSTVRGKRVKARRERF